MKPGDASPHVASLQNVLRLLLNRGIIRRLGSAKGHAARGIRQLARQLDDEQAQCLCGEATRLLVRLVETRHAMHDDLSGVVNESTAEVLNRLSAERIATDQPETGEFIVRGVALALLPQP